jgi:hypothetical protein
MMIKKPLGTFSSQTHPSRISKLLLKRHEKPIMEYALELGTRGALDGLETLGKSDEHPEVREDNGEHCSDGLEGLDEGDKDLEEAEDNNRTRQKGRVNLTGGKAAQKRR